MLRNIIIFRRPRRRRPSKNVLVTSTVGLAVAEGALRMIEILSEQLETLSVHTTENGSKTSLRVLNAASRLAAGLTMIATMPEVLRKVSDIHLLSFTMALDRDGDEPRPTSNTVH